MMAETLVMKQCATEGCDLEVAVEIPEDIVGSWRDLLLRVPRRCPEHQAEAEAEWAQEEADRLADEQRSMRQQREMRCGMPQMLRRLTWSDLDASGTRGKAIEAAQAWAEGRFPGLLLLGPVGRGKTRIAATAAWEMMGQREIRWTSASMLVAGLDGAFGSQERSQALGLVRGATALVIDDLDKVRPSEAVAEHILAAIDRRVTEGLPLLVTSNLSGVELAQRWPEPYGEAIVSRLRGYCRGFKLGGTDRRLT